MVARAVFRGSDDGRVEATGKRRVAGNSFLFAFYDVI
jgi:hypothetical protein